MKRILLLVVGIGVLSACATAKMAVAPELRNSSHVYKITEKPRLTGDKIRFGPYLASSIDRSFTRGSSITIQSYKNEKRSQSYTYNFKGESSWKAICKMRGKGQTIGAVEFGIETALNCTFNSVKKNKSKFTFNLVGPSLVEAKGKFSSGAKDFSVVIINKVQGSNLSMGYPVGYSFYSGNKLVAAVDSINSSGPVLLNKQLSSDEKDRVSLVMVALLLFQE